MFLAKSDEGEERCRILDSDNFSSCAIVHFFDTDRHRKLPYSDLRAIPSESDIRNIPKISEKFILAELVLTHEDPEKFKRFHDLIINKNATIVILNQVTCDLSLSQANKH
jgi:hypothetical protein